MGFQDEVYTHQNEPPKHKRQSTNKLDELSVNSKTITDELRPDDQHILDSIQDIYFTDDPNFDASKLILQVISSLFSHGARIGAHKRHCTRFSVPSA